MSGDAELRFDLGQIVATPAALQALENSGESPSAFLQRHARGDWGDVGADDQRQNDHAIADGSRVLSAYRTQLGVRLWIITEAADDGGRRLATTLLLPEEY